MIFDFQNQTVYFIEHASAPGTPPAGHVVIYAKADGLVYSKDDTGTEIVMSGGGGGVSEPNTQVVYGTGTSVDSSANFTYDTSNGQFLVNCITPGVPISISVPGSTYVSAPTATTPATQGGYAVLQAGNGSTSGAGGVVQLLAGNGGNSGSGGGIELWAGTAGSSAADPEAGGSVNIYAGAGNNNLALGGSIGINAGDGGLLGGRAGSIGIYTGVTYSGTDGGVIDIIAGLLQGSTANPNAGYVTIAGGQYSGTQTTNVNSDGGYVEVRGGITSWGNGATIFVGGAYADASVQYGGALDISGGNANTGSNADGGGIVISAGLGDGTGADGTIIINCPISTPVPHSWQPGLTFQLDEVVIGKPLVNNTGNAQIATSTDMRYTGCVAAPTMAGIPTGNATDGTLVVDETNTRLYVRVAGVWRYVTLT